MKIKQFLDSINLIEKRMEELKENYIDTGEECIRVKYQNLKAVMRDFGSMDIDDIEKVEDKIMDIIYNL